jgi:hypothetical protein
VSLSLCTPENTFSSTNQSPVRRNLTNIVAPDQAHLEVELEELSRPLAAHTRVARRTQGPGTTIPQPSASTSRCNENMVS